MTAVIAFGTTSINSLLTGCFFWCVQRNFLIMADEISDNEDLEKIMLQICDKDLLQAGAIGSDDDFAVEQLLRVPDNHAKHDHGKQ